MCKCTCGHSHARDIDGRPLSTVFKPGEIRSSFVVVVSCNAPIHPEQVLARLWDGSFESAAKHPLFNMYVERLAVAG